MSIVVSGIYLTPLMKNRRLGVILIFTFKLI